MGRRDGGGGRECEKKESNTWVKEKQQAIAQELSPITKQCFKVIHFVPHASVPECIWSAVPPPKDADDQGGLSPVIHVFSLFAQYSSMWSKWGGSLLFTSPVEGLLHGVHVRANRLATGAPGVLDWPWQNVEYMSNAQVARIESRWSCRGIRERYMYKGNLEGKRARRKGIKLPVKVTWGRAHFSISHLQLRHVLFPISERFRKPRATEWERFVESCETQTN